MKILSIEDHELIREALQLKLAVLADNVEVLSAANYKQAEILVEQYPDLDLILLDISLPDTNGFVALKNLHKNYPLHRLLYSLPQNHIRILTALWKA